MKNIKKVFGFLFGVGVFCMCIYGFLFEFGDTMAVYPPSKLISGLNVLGTMFLYIFQLGLSLLFLFAILALLNYAYKISFGDETKAKDAPKEMYQASKFGWYITVFLFLLAIAGCLLRGLV